MSSIDDMTLRRSVADNFCLGTEFETEEFCDVVGWTSEIVRNIQYVWNDSFDTITFPFDLLLVLNSQHVREITFDCTGCILYR